MMKPGNCKMWNDWRSNMFTRSIKNVRLTNNALDREYKIHCYHFFFSFWSWVPNPILWNKTNCQKELSPNKGHLQHKRERPCDGHLESKLKFNILSLFELGQGKLDVSRDNLVSLYLDVGYALWEYQKLTRT